MAIETLGHELREIRKRRGLTLDQVAPRVDELRGGPGGFGWLQRREAGGVSPDQITVGDLRILAELYGLPVTAILMLVVS